MIGTQNLAFERYSILMQTPNCKFTIQQQSSVHALFTGFRSKASLTALCWFFIQSTVKSWNCVLGVFVIFQNISLRKSFHPSASAKCRLEVERFVCRLFVGWKLPSSLSLSKSLWSLIHHLYLSYKHQMVANVGEIMSAFFFAATTILPSNSGII